jgi:RNA polymerase sigma-70 factor, ECF subfamily
MEQRNVDEAYKAWGGVIYRRCLRLLGERAAAEDATQEVFIRFMTAVDRLSPDGGYLRWIYRVATNLCLNRLRDEARLEVRDPATLVDAQATGGGASFVDRDLTVQLLRRFDEETQTVAVLALIDGLSHDEIAEVLDLSRKTVGKKLARFLENAQKFLKRASA